ncbi:sodium transporter HKT1-like [Prosopis cineraria]|uniref:sodium transporter HKT1-like n=1 Tax=Prosopis cineraria TaxID=364024 RepID=UPI00240FC543|nr:sodium transporter HKT1-like [Prosopis cineraria]XP_054782145.1 sodium transporter HKT1-like [Prosopis cineraria]
MKHLPSCFTSQLVSLIATLTMSSFRVLAVHVSPFCRELFYFMIMSVFGFLGLKIMKPRVPLPPSNFDLFFTSVSSATVSSMTAVEMEVFSNSQLILMTFLMFLGGEGFTSILGLLFSSGFNLPQKQSLKNRATTHHIPHQVPSPNQIEINLVSLKKQNELGVDDLSDSNIFQDDRLSRLKRRSVRCLGFVVLCSITVLHLVGSGLVSIYTSIVPSARQVLRNKGISIQTFSLFTIVSTIASCGFVPTNENMIVFKQNSGLLLLILPYVYLGNALYAPFVRFVIWVLEKVMKREEFTYILKNYKEIGYDHLLSGVHCWFLVATVFGLNLIQLVLFACMEWKSENMDGLNSYQKLIASLFQVSNARHAGESVFDLSGLSSAILVLFVVMMYLPPYTTFLPIKDHENETKKGKASLKECLLFSQLSYLVVFIILICITESKSMREDPLNFNVLSITLEVISAFGNVGFSMGYSCKRQLKADRSCRDLWIGLSGKWSNKGKFILIVVMLFGRLKKYNMRGGQAWDLS